MWLPTFWSCLSKSKPDQTIFEPALLSDRGSVFGFAAPRRLLCINICALCGEGGEKKRGILKWIDGSRDLSLLINHHLFFFKWKVCNNGASSCSRTATEAKLNGTLWAEWHLDVNRRAASLCIQYAPNKTQSKDAVSCRGIKPVILSLSANPVKRPKPTTNWSWQVLALCTGWKTFPQSSSLTYVCV